MKAEEGLKGVLRFFKSKANQFEAGELSFPQNQGCGAFAVLPEGVPHFLQTSWK